MVFLFPYGGLLLILALAALGFTIWMLVDAIQRPPAHFNPPDSKTWWIVGLAVGLGLSFGGLAIAIVYYFVVRKPATEGRFPAPPPSCRICGTRLAIGARFCSACGTAASPE